MGTTHPQGSGQLIEVINRRLIDSDLHPTPPSVPILAVTTDAHDAARGFASISFTDSAMSFVRPASMVR